MIVLRAGKRLDYTGIAALAAFGHSRVKVYRQPEVAIVATGDEIVEVHEHARGIPDPQFQRLVAGRAGGASRRRAADPAGGARYGGAHARDGRRAAWQADLLLLSGGVSAGKYDVVEQVLAGFGAEFYFDRVLIQPGQPLVFGRARGKFFFGLPGNPSSTMVTFEIFARAALDLLAGSEETILPMPYARLTRDFRHRAGLTRFLPARLSADGAEVTPVDWHGSGDIPALTRANAFLVADPDRAEYRARRAGSGCCSNEETVAFRFRRQHRAWWMSPPSRQTRRTARAHAFVRIAPAVLRRLPREPQGQPAGDRAHRRHRGRQTHSRTDPAVPSPDADPCRCRGRRGEARRAHRRHRRHHRRRPAWKWRRSPRPPSPP